MNGIYHHYRRVWYKMHTYYRWDPLQLRTSIFSNHGNNDSKQPMLTKNDHDVLAEPKLKISTKLIQPTTNAHIGLENMSKLLKFLYQST